VTAGATVRYRVAMCIFCGDLSDPFHGLGPAPLMVATVVAGRAWRGTVRPTLIRDGRPSPRPATPAEADDLGGPKDEPSGQSTSRGWA